MVDKLTNKQMQVLWVQARELGLSSFHLHELAHELTGKDSIKALSVREAAEFIDFLKDAGGRIKKKRRPPRNLPSNVVEMPSPDQVRYVKFLEKQLGWQEDPARMKRYLRHTIKKDAILRKPDAIKAIEGLKSMMERKKRKEVNHG